ncbi:uncharacterized protein C15orf62 homolog, mitochondrial [Microcaecilia unicolor]|uniref:Uncharacterized protein C15orf62 homolog, mitochondrial n=1 Tax=Microcaecilia unicolor TaxID=1415580 RepID=A0A6P7YZD1_9AMPH|nr:uncharacterized protein C15orf62 homolog, mitochondrial [Microcaecilia unicolor]
MDIWRKGSFRSSKFFTSLSTSKHKTLEPEKGPSNEVKYLLQENGQGIPLGTKCYKMEEGLGNLTPLSQKKLRLGQTPQKPPRLYLNSSAHSNIQEYSTSLCALSSVSSLSSPSTPRSQTSESFPDHSDPLLSFHLDLGPSLLEDILQTLNIRSYGDSVASNCLLLLGSSIPGRNGNCTEEL